MSETTTCPDCDTENNVTEWRENVNVAGKVELKCTDCGKRLLTEFYCTDCDSFHGGRASLKKYDNGSVAKYCCPDCDGLIGRGKVLDVKQGVHR